MKLRVLSMGVAAFLAGCMNAHPMPVTNPFHLDMAKLERDRVLHAAAKDVGQRPVTITAYHAERSPGGAHDFYSEGDYYWPDPRDPKAVWVGHDGESSAYMYMDHRRTMWRMERIVAETTAAYLLTGDKKYSETAIAHLKAWFADPATRMNPNLQYAQRVVNKGTFSAFGLIDTLHLVEPARCVVVLRERGALSKEDDAAITGWFREYNQWLTTSEPGVKEGNATNNHASAYWLQIAAFSQVTREERLLAEARHRFKTQLLGQMAPDGSFPREMARTKPYGYSIFQLDQLVMLAWIASTPEDNLFTYTTADGKTLRTAVEFLYPYIKDKSKWTKKPDVMIFDLWPVRCPTWLYAAYAYNEPQYLLLWLSLEPNPTNEEVLRNLPVRQPVLWEKRL